MVKRLLKAYAESYEFRTEIVIGFIMIPLCILDSIGWIIATHCEYSNLSDILAILFIVHLISGSAWLNAEKWNGIDDCIERGH